MSLTKQEIDALVDGMARGIGDPPCIILEEGGYYIHPGRMRRALYLAAGLTAEGQEKSKRVRCVQVINPEYSTDRHFWAEAYEGQFPPHYQLTPGWFVPDGEEG